MKYSEFIAYLKGYSEEEFATFQRKLIPTKQMILGVRTPTLRKIAKEFSNRVDLLFSYPDEYYEVTFIKLTAVSLLTYEQFIGYVGDCVAKMDNWATCDSFKAKCIERHKDEFFPILENLFNCGGEFYERYVLVSFLSYYVQEEYLPSIERYLYRADTEKYYVHMAVAWLTAEIIIKYYEQGIAILKSQKLDVKTHNKAIQKAIESYRVTKEQKEYLRSLKIKI